MARQPGDESLQIRFYVNHELSEYQSAQQGKDVYVDIENIQIIIPGMRDTVARQVTSEDKERFADEYKAWKKELAAPITGMPLEEWPGASLDLIKNLNQFGVRSVEDLIAVDDSAISGIAGAATAKTRAIAQQDSIDKVAKFTALAKENEMLKVDISVLNKQIADRDAVIADLTEKLTTPDTTSKK